MRTGRVSFGGPIKIVSLCCVPDAKPGDYVLVHAGLALSVADPVEAQATLRRLRESGELAELDADAATRGGTKPAATP